MVSDVTSLFNWIFGFLGDFFNFLDFCVFKFYDYEISLGGFLFAILFISIGISVFWRGGKT